MSDYDNYPYFQLTIPGPTEVVAYLLPEERLWEQAFQASEIGAQAQAHLNELYDSAMAKRASANYVDRQDAVELEREYWSETNHLQELRAVEGEILSVLEQFEAGDLTRDDIARYLPHDDSEETLSKRKLAIQRAKEKGRAAELTRMELFMYGYSHWLEGPDLTSDPRRLATGRNLTKLVARQGLTPFEAKDKFFEVTADTHGGKSRRPGKGPTHYVSSSGRRIRKR